MTVHAIAITPMPLTSTLALLWAKADRPAVRAFFLSITALTVALLLALYSGAAARTWPAWLWPALPRSSRSLIAAWVAVTLVPILAKRTAASLDRLQHGVPHHAAKAGSIIVGIILVALAALNTGNNLLFLILASLIAIRPHVRHSFFHHALRHRNAPALPEHIFAGQPVRALLELQNEKLTLPSFSLRVEAVTKKDFRRAPCSKRRSIFHISPSKKRVQQTVPTDLSAARRLPPGSLPHRHPFPFWISAKSAPPRS